MSAAPAVEPSEAARASRAASRGEPGLKIGMRMGVALFNYYAVTMSAGPDMEFCRMVAWTSAGKRLVNLTVNWTNPATGQFYVRVNGYSNRLW